VIDATCRLVRQALEGEGVLSHEASAHLDACSACRAHAALLVTFARVTARKPDEAAVRRIVAALPPAPWQRRRVATWLPLAAGVGLVGTGFALLGGVPAPGAVAELPGVAGGFLTWLGSSVLDAVVAARASSEAVRVTLAAGGLWLVLWAAVTALGGGWALRVLVRPGIGGRG
jgi:predicted anti-sigma-YlaC factor YlaD